MSRSGASVSRHGYRGRAAYVTGWRWSYGFTVLVWGCYGVTLGVPRVADNRRSWSPVGFFSYRDSEGVKL